MRIEFKLPFCMTASFFAYTMKHLDQQMIHQKRKVAQLMTEQKQPKVQK